MIKTLKTIILASALVAPMAISAQAAEFVINMKNKGADGTAMVFEPNFVRAAVGDTVKFVPVDKGHFVQSLPNLWPAGVGEAKGEMNQELVVKLEKDGLYSFKCAPHYAMGMVALVQVGNAPVTDEVKAIAFPGPVGKRMADALAMAAKP